MSALLATRALTAFYGDFQALYGIDFEISPGEAVAIIGANGAGKSTFLRSLAGLVLTGGDGIVFDGDRIERLPAHVIARRGLALVPEGRRLFPSLDVEENLKIGADRAAPEGISVGLFPLVTFACAALVIAALEQLFRRNRIGRAFRAASDDPEVIELMGYDRRHVYALAMALAFAVVGLSGVLFGIGTIFDPAFGPPQLLFAFEAVIIGGMGSLWGTLAGSMILGISQAIGFRVDPGWGILAGHLAFLAILAVRPRGLFPRTRDA